MTLMSSKRDWEIVHIPEKPPIPPHQQPTVNVYAALIDPKHTNTLVRKLNQIAPLENLRHVKRVRKQHLEKGYPTTQARLGGVELSALFCYILYSAPLGFGNNQNKELLLERVMEQSSDDNIPIYDQLSNQEIGWDLEEVEGLALMIKKTLLMLKLESEDD
ncbi:hypothetical protein TEA_023595 [Camellia sinensis var. sinensis]|uniref:Uncharacterized protein n=1 Tax=Camellia sinensis var. sinensis TaxID=542762 RepID=A0A4S4EZB4_CAMSN|nr:hypothetical protein TEA_023595 [Camellia sinensis var. sinensis]